MGRESINDFVPSVMNPRAVRKSAFPNYLSQTSTTSRFSLSLKRPGKTPRKALQDISHTQNTVKMTIDKGPLSSNVSFGSASEKIDGEIAYTITDNDSHSKLIHSCTTELYDLEPHMKMSSASQKSVITVDSDDEVVYNISTLDQTTNLQQNGCVTPAKNNNKTDNLTLVINNRAVRQFSEIIIEPTYVRFRKRKKPLKMAKVQKKITGYLRKTKSPKKFILPKSYTIYSDNDLQTESSGTSKNSNHMIADNIEQRLQNKIDTKLKPNSHTALMKKKATPEVPPHKIVNGTRFAVDAFCYGPIPNISTYFLTHFHSDHYMGLRKSFAGVIYCSSITADLCVAKLGVSRNCIKVINVDDTVLIDGVEVSALDANHCPGSLMLVFRLPGGRNVLHCGDFRASSTMESHPLFWNMDIHTAYLDTTYCRPRYDFPPQEESVDMAVAILEHTKGEMNKNNKDFGRALVVCGTYTIGKENFFLGLRSWLGCGVWAPPHKAASLRTVLGPTFTIQQQTSAQLHLLDMGLINYEDLKQHLISMNGAFSEVVAFKPSGWETTRQNRTVIVRDNVAIYGIPYSEHSSFSELIRFVKFLRPELVIPTVPIPGGIGAVQKYFPCPLALKDDRSQKKISEFLNVKKRVHVPAIT